MAFCVRGLWAGVEGWIQLQGCSHAKMVAPGAVVGLLLLLSLVYKSCKGSKCSLGEGGVSVPLLCKSGADCEVREAFSPDPAEKPGRQVLNYF